MSNTVIAYSGAHPAHQKLLAGLDAKSIKMLGEWTAGGNRTATSQKFITYVKTAWNLRKDRARAVIIEGTTPAMLMAPVIKLFNPRPKTIIAWCADDVLYRAFVKGSRLNRAALRFGFRYVSGIVTDGDFIAGLSRKHLFETPVEVRYPPIQNATIDLCAKVIPSLESHNLLLIGSGSQYCKGVDIATATIGALRTTYTDACLTIIGFTDVLGQGIETPGQVPSIEPYLTKSSVLIHAVRGDAFPIVVVEAMLAGVVPFVSELTGAAMLAGKVDPNLVVPLNDKEFAQRIAAFWETTPEYRKTLSDRCRQVAREFVIQTEMQESLQPFIDSFAKNSSS